MRMSALDPLPNGFLPSEHNEQPSHEYSLSEVEEESNRPMSPLQMPPGQIDGLASLKEDSYFAERGQSPHRRGSNDSLLHLNIPRYPSQSELALSAMQYLPYPMAVLNSLKMLVMANEAMGRLLGLADEDGDSASDDGTTTTDRLRGQTLTQMGIDMLQDGRPVWVNWESFLNSLSDEVGMHMNDELREQESEIGEGDVTPTAERPPLVSRRSSEGRSKSTVHDAVVEVVVPQENIAQRAMAQENKGVGVRHVFAKMIITVWEIEEEKFFTLTFTNTDSSQTSLPSSRGQSRQVARAVKHHHSTGSSGSGSHSSPSSVSSGRSSNHGGSSNSSAITSPTNASLSASPFPPLGPPTKSTISSASSSLQKVIMMKDALLDGTETPILAMWKDESLTVPNKAARRLFHPTADLSQVKDGFDLVTKWHVWDETFTTRLDPSEYPVSKLMNIPMILKLTCPRSQFLSELEYHSRAERLASTTPKQIASSHMIVSERLFEIPQPESS
jgi:hypothetical protein